MLSARPLQLLHAGSYRAARGQDFPPHRHNCWELVFYRTGNIEVPIGDEIFITRPGLLLCTPPGVVHCERAKTAYVNDFIAIEAPVDAPWPRCVADDSYGTLSYLCRALVAFSRAATDAPDAKMAQLLVAQLDYFVRSRREDVALPHGEVVVRAAEQIFQQEFATPLQVRAVARELNIAPSALRAYFARFRGYSPGEALARVRLQHALSLLRSSDLSLQQIAGASGFYSPSHLSRHVKAATHMAPGRWRNRTINL